MLQKAGIRRVTNSQNLPIVGMESVVLRSVMTALPGFEEGGAARIEKIWESAQVFFDWEHETMIIGNPTEEQKKDHRSMLKIMTLIVGLLQKIESNNESIKMLQTRLDDSWGMFYNPMTESEAEAVLKKAFPG
jgi:hypothetical protein